MLHYNYQLLKKGPFQTARLTLRPFEITDDVDLLAITSDELTTKFLYPAHTKLEEAQNMLANYYKEEPIGKYAVVLNETNTVIGAVEFRIDRETKSGDLGYLLNSNYWGKGYMTEACRAMLAVAFNDLQLNRVHAGCESENTASENVMKRIGMVKEGVTRQDHLSVTGICDSLRYSILKSEYDTQQMA